MSSRSVFSSLLVLLLFGFTYSQSPKRSSRPGGRIKPGALISMTTQSLRQVPAARQMVQSLPSGAGNSLVITCQYSPASAGKPREVYYFWHSQTPQWLSTVTASHPIFSLIRREADQCPGTTLLANPEHAASASAQRPARSVASLKTLTP